MNVMACLEAAPFGRAMRVECILRRHAVKMRLLGHPLGRSHRRMDLKSILNCFEPLNKTQRFVEVAGCPRFLEVDIELRANSRPICSGSGEKRPGYDRLAARRFEFVPLCNMAGFFIYAMRRVDCPTCGVTVERVPWASGKWHLTTSSRCFLPWAAAQRASSKDAMARRNRQPEKRTASGRSKASSSRCFR